jgi:hypothetical protein
MMKITKTVLLGLATLCTTSSLHADSLELVDGSVVEGTFTAFSNDMVIFDSGDSVEAYARGEVIAIFLSEGVAAAEVMAAQPAPSTLTVPEGTRLVIRMVDSVDSKKHKAGHKFRGQLEGALVVDGVTAAPRGAFLYGVVVASNSSGRAVGSSSLAMEFTDIMIDDQLFPIATSALGAQTGNEAGRTVGRTARTAAIGGLIGGSSGARTGAKVGLGASILTSGSSVNVPAGTLLETTIRIPLNL